MGRNKKQNRKRHQRDKKQGKCFLVRTGRAGRSDLAARIPELSSLRDKKITVVGLGCLGAPSVLEFTRCGVSEIRVIDFDIVEAGTIVRWPLGLQAVGRYKTEVISDFIEKNYPYTKIVAYRHKVGELRLDENQRSELDVLESALYDSDLVFDASAELGIQYLMSDLAAELKISFVGISTTFGAWGGILVRIRPRVTEGCWLCYRKYCDDQIIQEPNVDPKGKVQPTGCASPTFTGTAFDSGIIAYSGVRLAISTLCEDGHNGYPRFDWDVAVVNLRDEKGSAMVPFWQTYNIEKHPSCNCSKKL